MIDKEKYTSFIRDDETKVFIVKNMSKVEGVLKHFDVRRTDFMNPYEQRVFLSILNAFSHEISYEMYGGDAGERKLFVIHPIYIENVECPVKLIRLKGNFSFERITHRDCLGALMAQGIAREKTGDIHIHENHVDIVVDESIDNYIASNMSSIRHCSVKASILDIGQLKPSAFEMQEKVMNVASLRIDSILSEALNIPRKLSASLVSGGKVKVNYEPVTNSSKEVVENSLFSVKGYGRFVFLSKLGVSKKGKMRIRVAYYS